MAMARRKEALRKLLDQLMHSSQCRLEHCQYPNCHKVKGLFRHGISCAVRATGGCLLCQKMWYLLQLHARQCDESRCHIPQCKDLKKHIFKERIVRKRLQSSCKQNYYPHEDSYFLRSMCRPRLSKRQVEMRVGRSYQKGEIAQRASERKKLRVEGMQTQ